MSALTLSGHARVRLRQRGMREADVETIVTHGTLIGDDTYVLRSDDVAREIERRKGEIARLERLRNRKVVLGGQTVVTCCHVHDAGWKRLRGRHREWTS